MDNLTEEQAFAKEIEFIKLYKSLGYCETNLTDGGDGPSGYKYTDEDRKRCSEAHKGQIPKNKGVPFTDEQIQKVKESHWTKRGDSDEIKKRMSVRRTGFSATWFNKPILATSLETQQTYNFISGVEAAKALNCCFKKISAVANGKRKSHKGFSFKFTDQQIKEVI